MSCLLIFFFSFGKHLFVLHQIIETNEFFYFFYTHPITIQTKNKRRRSQHFVKGLFDCNSQISTPLSFSLSLSSFLLSLENISLPYEINGLAETKDWNFVLPPLLVVNYAQVWLSNNDIGSFKYHLGAL